VGLTRFQNDKKSWRVRAMRRTRTIFLAVVTGS